MQSVKRRVKRKSGVNVSQSFLMKEYNSRMGGVDAMDWLLGSDRPTIRGKNGIGY